MPRLLVLGGDAAGMSAVTVVQRGAPDAEVVVVERGGHTSYSMCGIPYYVGGEIASSEELVVRRPDEFRATGVTVHLHTEATAIDPSARTVRVRDLASGLERDEPYDALLYAIGASVVVPPVPGVAEYGHVVHTLDEGEHLRAHLDRWESERGDPQQVAAAGGNREVVVLGAGYIGIEVAEALVRRGFSSVLVDRSDQVMGTLDPDMAAIVQGVVADFGVQVHLGQSLEEVRAVGVGPGVEVVCSQGVFPTELLVVATGARPNVGVAEAAGAAVGTSGALVVDEQMRTTLAGVWAAGDVVESRHLVSDRPANVQLGTHANKQGKVAGQDIAAVLRGEERGAAAFPGVVGTAVTRVCEWEIGRTGLTEREATAAGLDYEAVRFTGTARAGYLPDHGVVHVKLLAERGTGRVLGCQLVGTGNVAKRIDVAAVWCQLGVTVQQAQVLDLSYAPPFGGVWDLLQVAAMKLAKRLELSPSL